MLGIGTKLFGGLSVILMLYIAYAQVKMAQLESNLKTSQDNVIELNRGLDEEKASNKTMIDVVVAGVAREANLKNDLQETRTTNSELSNEINNLRMKENAKALQQPFERGGAANLRLRNTWMRLEGSKNSSGIASEDPPSDNQ